MLSSAPMIHSTLLGKPGRRWVTLIPVSLLQKSKNETQILTAWLIAPYWITSVILLLLAAKICDYPSRSFTNFSGSNDCDLFLIRFPQKNLLKKFLLKPCQLVKTFRRVNCIAFRVQGFPNIIVVLKFSVLIFAKKASAFLYGCFLMNTEKSQRNRHARSLIRCFFSECFSQLLLDHLSYRGLAPLL